MDKKKAVLYTVCAAAVTTGMVVIKVVAMGINAVAVFLMEGQ